MNWTKTNLGYVSEISDHPRGDDNRPRVKHPVTGRSVTSAMLTPTHDREGDLIQWDGEVDGVLLTIFND